MRANYSKFYTKVKDNGFLSSTVKKLKYTLSVDIFIENKEDTWSIEHIGIISIGRYDSDEIEIINADLLECFTYFIANKKW